ncbi:Fe-S oxidoreductase [Enemella dayhoffiae]|uniref:Fe-S oxidoreductase n=1 Tax=Enemella dayhoffiae TaxID=2016507 RepID=A0A255GVG5_9ACTN|nr:(Fe-S)-binding protein [Enemella dayhoffiae]OYO17214.1 Fe-S oxidoreductase [Enemella dayhoffiae]
MTELTRQTDRPGEGVRVALFATCINDTLYPGTARAVVTLLERLGCTVEFPLTQTCCGQPFTNTGYFDEAMGSVRTFVDSFADQDHVVVPSGSCAGSIREQHPMLARRHGDQGLTAEVQQLVPRTRELSEFLVDVLKVTDVGAYFPHRVTYHPTCHSLRVCHVGDRPLQLLQQVRGLTLAPLAEADQCCGFGGTFAVKNADVSVSMGGDKVRRVLDTGAEYLVAGDNSCLTHLGGLLSRQRTGVRPIHLAEILASTEEDG